MGYLEVVADERSVRGVEIHPGASHERETDAVTERYISELEQYLRGERREFDWPLAFDVMPPFRLRVLQTLRGVPFGETVSYGQLAEMAGSPGAARATGQAVGANPFGIVVPCHRVIASGGKLGGYGGGLAVKVFLLEHEARCCEGDEG
jgi:methylated-DNA-[protein]-cysteine S-methyltransferase